MRKRELQRATLEIAILCIAWVLGAGWLLEDALPSWAVIVAQFGGAILLALAVGWLRVIRHGPSGPAAAAAELADDEAALSSAYLVTAIGSGAMCVWLLADGGDGTGWGLVFGAIAAFQLWRYLRGRG